MSNIINKVKATLSGSSDSTNAGPHHSNAANAADPRVDSDRDHRGNPASNVGGYGGQTGTTGHHTTTGTSGFGSTGHQTTGGYGDSTTAGPHGSNLANKLDPRVDSDRDNRGNPASSVGGYGGQTGTTAHHTTTSGYGDSTTAGPHSSNLANKLDPRVDSDRDNRGNPTSSVGGYGGQTGTTGAGYGSTGHHTTGGTGGFGSTGHQTTGGYGDSTNAGPHNSNLANKMDPRVDSDRDNRGNPTSSVGGYGGQTGTGGYGSTGHQTTTGGYGGSTTAGPHDSNIANKLDPRVDSDRDNRGNPASSVGGYGGQGATHTGTSGFGTGSTTHGSSGYGHGTTNTGGAGGYDANPGSGNAPNTAGPHNSDLLNKLDPRVDSDLDGSKTYGGNQTHR